MGKAMQGSLRDIRLFVAAYEERSFTLAAQREFATQSGVSQHVRNLEDGFGVRLFTRDHGKISPTPAGDAYYRRCIDVIRAHDAASRAVATFAHGLDGQITVGLMPSMTRCSVAPALARFIEAHPNVDVRVIEAYSGALTQMVRAGELDFAIVPGFAGDAGLRCRHFLTTPELLVARAGGAGVGHGAVRLAELGPMRLVLPSRANTRRITLETYCATVGAEIARVVELDAMFATLDFVARSEWMTILPAIMMGRDVGPGLVASAIAEPPLGLDLMLIEPARRALAPAAEIFLALLEVEAREASSVWAEQTHQAGADRAPAAHEAAS
jgi:LysR family transcriptional regulator, nitrogen assimilation regulatory protein